MALTEGDAMPATTPQQIHRLFEEMFNAGDIDGLMTLYEPDSALVPQPGNVARAPSRCGRRWRPTWRSGDASA